MRVVDSIVLVYIYMVLTFYRISIPSIPSNLGV